MTTLCSAAAFPPILIPDELIKVTKVVVAGLDPATHSVEWPFG
jgi:hypothetical protein